MNRAAPIVTIVLSLSLCACAPPPESAGAGSLSQPIYYGTRDPQNIALTEGEQLAIGWFFTQGSPASAWCSGTVIAPRVVASAEHCLRGVRRLSRVGFGVGTMPTSPEATFGISQVHAHPHLDVALFILSEVATETVPDLVPIASNRAAPNQWLGDPLDASGYGQTHDGSIGRYFATVWLEQVFADTVEVDGRGEQGICFGDSGGPLLAPGPVVVAVESYGDPSCVGRDTMVRLDTLSDWIDDIVERYEGAPEPCDGLDYLGRCDGHVAEWCDGNEIRRHDCAGSGQTCGWVDDQVGYYCVEGAPVDPCGGLDFLGRCDGDVAEWCENEAVHWYDCADDGLTCAYVDDEVGHDCVDAAGDDDGGGESDDGGGGGGLEGSGCGCQSTAAPMSAAAWMLLLLGAAWMRRRSPVS